MATSVTDYSRKISGGEINGVGAGGVKPKFSRQLHQPHVTPISCGPVRFLITDQPTNSNMDGFIMTCKFHKVKKLVRVSELTYDKDLLESNGIDVVDLEFDDGTSPPDWVLDTWFQVIIDLWNSDREACVAVHCKAGLGRAPVLVAAALIELGLPYDEVAGMIRERRDGALNLRQIHYLKNYRPHKRLRQLKNPTDRCCIL